MFDLYCYQQTFLDGLLNYWCFLLIECFEITYWPSRLNCAHILSKLWEAVLYELTLSLFADILFWNTFGRMSELESEVWRRSNEDVIMVDSFIVHKSSENLSESETSSTPPSPWVFCITLVLCSRSIEQVVCLDRNSVTNCMFLCLSGPSFLSSQSTEKLFDHITWKWLLFTRPLVLQFYHIEDDLLAVKDKNRPDRVCVGK